MKYRDNFKIGLACVVLTSIAGCSAAGSKAGYGPRGSGLIGSGFGYSNKQISDDTWMVDYVEVSSALAKKGAQRRAEELCTDKGYSSAKFTASLSTYDDLVMAKGQVKCVQSSVKKPTPTKAASTTKAKTKLPTPNKLSSEESFKEKLQKDIALETGDIERYERELEAVNVDIAALENSLSEANEPLPTTSSDNLNILGSVVQSFFSGKTARELDSLKREREMIRGGIQNRQKSIRSARAELSRIEQKNNQGQNRGGTLSASNGAGPAVNALKAIGQLTPKAHIRNANMQQPQSCNFPSNIVSERKRKVWFDDVVKPGEYFQSDAALKREAARIIKEYGKSDACERSKKTVQSLVTTINSTSNTWSSFASEYESSQGLEFTCKRPGSTSPYGSGTNALKGMACVAAKSTYAILSVGYVCNLVCP